MNPAPFQCRPPHETIIEWEVLVQGFGHDLPVSTLIGVPLNDIFGTSSSPLGLSLQVWASKNHHIRYGVVFLLLFSMPHAVYQ